jgi:DNA (cytosine-5)-methyltransferase 1
MRPRLLDLFCGAGGAAMGYHRAGFDVVGVDIKPQPHYPFEFIQADALEYPLEGFDAIHASPPCQGYTTMNGRYGSVSPRLIADVRRVLETAALAGHPYVIENVLGAHSQMVEPVELCGASFGLSVRRHRLFECNFPVMRLACACQGDELPVYGKLDGRRLWTRRDGTELRAAATLEEAQTSMGIDWMDWDELREAIPPAYTEHIGHYLMAELRQKAAA